MAHVKIACWNCQGLGNPMTVQRIREIHKKFSPDVLFLMETKNADDVVLKAVNDLSYSNSFLVSPQGHGSGGLALFWKHDVKVDVISSCNNYMDTTVEIQGRTFYATFVYGDPDFTKRRPIWKHFQDLALVRTGPWYLAGDFNDIVDNSEKKGGPERAEGTFVDFRSFISECDLYDIRHSGNPLSWRGVRYTHVVTCRLDRAMANSLWAEEFPNGRCQYLPFEGSDHRPIITHFGLEKKKTKGLFRYDRRLKDNEEVKTLIKDTWLKDERASVQSRIAKCRHALVTWNKEKQRNSQHTILKLKEDLEQAMVSPIHDEAALEKINSELKNAYKAEEAFWKQRSRQLWLSLGDKNTSYFHAATRGRNAINKFSVLENEEGKAFYEDDQIAEVIFSYYLKLFSSPIIENETMEDIVREALIPCVTEENNQRLIGLPSTQEIREAVFNIHPGKAPGPDGFSSCFFQSNWEAVGPALVQEIQDFFRTGVMPHNLNETHVRLIPKVQGPRKVADYRPIALCNVYYKTISKILTRRLQPFLSQLISDNQSAFVPNRAISDNVLITHEVLYYLKTSGAKKHVSMAVKTDMSKAYDRVEWSFLKSVLHRFGFHSNWIKWIMQCVTTVSYSFLVNGSPRGKVHPLKGIRQGDPLSPYLFILCSEVLSGLCKKAEESGSLQGIRVSRGSPRINHLLFADDTMFFCKANENACAAFKEILKKYESVSGQRINSQKSSITFSKKTAHDQKAKTKRLLGIEKEGGIGKYLGLPEHFGRKKKDLFTSIVDRIRQKALSWSNKFLSGAGKLTLLKSVLTAIPSYAMSCFQLPGSLCKRVQSALTRFWWDSNAQKKSMCWVSWDKLTKSKQNGGLGFRDLQNFNTALLGKLAWRLIQNPESLLAKVLLGKYCHSTSFTEAKCPNSASHGWRSVITGRDLLLQKLGWVIGDGNTVRIWEDPWLSLSSSSKPMGPAPLHSSNLRVKDLFIPGTVEWDTQVVKKTLPAYSSEILAIKPSRLGAADKQVWLGHPSGIYSTKSGYHTAKETDDRNQVQAPSSHVNWRTEVWNIQTAPKIKVFLWKALQGALPTGSQLLSRNIASDIVCCRCGEVESILHLLFTCPFARKIWSLAPTTPYLPCDLLEDVRSGFVRAKHQTCLPPVGLGSCPLFPWICWNIWKTRNQKIFNEICFSEEETLIKAVKDAKEWQDAQGKEPQVPSGSGLTRAPPERLHPLTMICNTDAAWRTGDKSAGLGWTFRKASSNSTTLHSAACENVASPLMAEALACRLAIMEAIKAGVSHLKLDSDCQNLVRAINSKILLPEIHGIMSDIVLSINSLSCFVCCFIPRSANSVADGLAKQCLAFYSSG